MSDLKKVAIAALASVFAWFLVQHAPCPTPTPVAPPIAIPRKRPLLPWSRQAKVGGDVAPDGTPVQIDFPKELRMENVGGSDGAGLCVFTSINHAALWQNVEVLKDFQHWMRSKRGGGWPEKVDRMIAAKAKEAGVEKPQYVQVEGEDLELIDLACKTGRMPCVTYGFSPSGRYRGRYISHMVNCVHSDGKNIAILDNNYIEALEWDTRDEFRRAYTSDGGWTFVLLTTPPPPPPRNKK
jgi:hypothetical protein